MKKKLVQHAKFLVKRLHYLGTILSLSFLEIFYEVDVKREWVFKSLGSNLPKFCISVLQKFKLFTKSVNKFISLPFNILRKCLDDLSR